MLIHISLGKLTVIFPMICSVKSTKLEAKIQGNNIRSWKFDAGNAATADLKVDSKLLSIWASMTVRVFVFLSVFQQRHGCTYQKMFVSIHSCNMFKKRIKMVIFWIRSVQNGSNLIKLDFSPIKKCYRKKLSHLLQKG